VLDTSLHQLIKISIPSFSGIRVTRFIYRCLSFSPFSFGHCIVCSSAVDGFWWHLCHLQTFRQMRVKQQAICVYPFEASFKSFHKKAIFSSLCTRSKVWLQFWYRILTETIVNMYHDKPTRTHYRDPEYASLWSINLSVFVLTPICSLLSRHSAYTLVRLLGLKLPEMEVIICCTLIEQAKYYAINLNMTFTDE
jgi:hypothetical protein